MIGTTILNYRIEEKLGDGGMGVVYRATDIKLGRQVALKFLPAFVSGRTEEKERFMAEARMASCLDHPNIATIYEVNEADGKLFYAMSLVEGLTLKSLRQQGPITHKQIIQIATQIADGLAHAHDHDVVHRDIKPQNVMVTAKGLVKILDFGLAKLTSQESVSGSTSTAGTAAYISPEQAQGNPATPQSDLFSLGVVLYELLSGELPFKGEHPAAIVYSIVHENPIPLAQVAPDIPPQIVAIVDRLLQKDPNKRFASAAELAEALRAVSRELEYSSFSGSVRTYKAEVRMGWKSVVVTVLAILALGIGAAYMLEGGGGKSLEAGDQYDLAVMYFDDLSSDAAERRVGEMITELLITDLSRSPYLRVLSSQRLYDILKQLDHEGQREIDRTVATDVARRAHARNMITGSFARAGERSRLTVNVIEVATGEVILSEQVEGTDLFSMVDSASSQIKGRLDLPAEKRLASGGSVSEAATTNNAEAYLHYVKGLEAYHKFDWVPALAQFDSAIALDSGFALAYVRAAIVAMSSYQATRGYTYLNFGRAALKDASLPPRESLLVAAFNALVDNNVLKANELFDQMQTRFPDDKEAYFWHGNSLLGTGDTRDAIPLLEKSLQLDPNYSFALLLLVEAYHDIGDVAKAIATAERYRNLRPNEAMPRLSLASMYIQEDMFDQARAELQEAHRLEPNSIYAIVNLVSFYARTGDWDSVKPILQPLMHDTSNSFFGVAHRVWAGALFLDGHFRDAIREARHSVELEKTYGDSLAVVGHLLSEISMFLVLSQPDSARPVWQQAYRINPKDMAHSMVPARIELYAGDFIRARAIADSVARRSRGILSDKQIKINESAFEGEVAFHRGEWNKTIKAYEYARKLAEDPNDYAFYIGRAYLETGEAGRAVKEFTQCTRRYDPLSPSSYWIRSWYYLGRADEALGNRGNAVNAYRKFLSYWGGADIKLPEIVDAKSRLADLSDAS